MSEIFNKLLIPKSVILLLLSLSVLANPLPGEGLSPEDIIAARSPIRLLPDEVVYHAEPLGDFESITIPLKRAGRLLLIETQVDGQTGNFVFDTGATGLVLNRTYFRDYKAMNEETAHGITGQLGLVERIKVERIDIGDLYYVNQTADMADLGHIENQRGVRILGLFGFDMIKGFEIEIDFSGNQLHLHRINKKGMKLDASAELFKPDCVLPIIGRRDVVIVKGQVGDAELNFCLDTGAETNALSARVGDDVMKEVNIMRRTNLRGAGSSKREVLFGQLNHLTVGPKQFSNLDVVVTPLDHLSDVYGTRIDGMLGFSFLEDCVVCINLRKKEVGFKFKKKGDE
ncbi:MAG TPA: hypothetical protein DCR43_02070 [Bacteroidales bacterium]|nr:MAG: hypothetical protein A2X11_11920 [Bacteroidetes bacterium GWE2_42_24]OFY31046.1 MAG: hypothetical protein A2X09_15870 [Bacteroidetes bacterium GWF2_43_11]HAQ64635.1 hypothetical protein [Bacteroidales bacterium]HBZ66585.1 hypothetical protein [Bacteroidales bacterium]